MTEEEFDILAAKVLGGEATAEEAAGLQSELARRPHLREKFAELSATWSVLKSFGPLANALDAPPAVPPLERVKRWRDAVENRSAPLSQNLLERTRQQRGPRSDAVGFWFRWKAGLAPWGMGCGFVAIVIVVAFLLWPDSKSTAPFAYLAATQGPVKVLRERKRIAVDSGIVLRASDEIQLLPESSATVLAPAGVAALRGPGTFKVGKISAALIARSGNSPMNGAFHLINVALFEPSSERPRLLLTTRSTPGISIYAPLGFTADLTPLIVWKTQPGRAYEVIISDEFSPAAWRATNVLSPLKFTNAWPSRALARDGLYRLRITEDGNRVAANELTFRTLPQAGEITSGQGAKGLVAAYRMLVDDPPRFGDSLAILLTLPPELGDSELALRLKLFAFARLGYQADFHALHTRLQTAR